MIIWLAATATPQFTPILNTLAQVYSLPLSVYYMSRGSEGRGWGDLNIQHPHEYHTRRGWLRDLLTGIIHARRCSTEAIVVLGYSTPFAMGLLLGSRISGVPVFTMSDSNYEQECQKSLVHRILKHLLLRVLYSRRTRVWVVGRLNSRYWRLYGLRNQRFVHFESPIPEHEGSRQSEFVSGASHGVTVLYVGRPASEKRVQDAVLAVQSLRAEHIDVSLRLVGSKPDESILGSECPEGWLQLVGPVPHCDLSREYRRADVLVLPSDVEPYGLVVREALQFGLPVVATNAVAAAKELCDRGWNIVPPRDPRALAFALRHAINLGVRWPPMHPIDTSSFYAQELAVCRSKKD